MDMFRTGDRAQSFGACRMDVFRTGWAACLVRMSGGRVIAEWADWCAMRNHANVSDGQVSERSHLGGGMFAFLLCGGVLNEGCSSSMVFRMLCSSV